MMRLIRNVTVVPGEEAVVPLGFIVIIVVSLLTPAPDKETQELVDHVRYPVLEGDIDTRGT